MQFTIDPQLADEIVAKVNAAESEATLEVIRVAELGKNGRITTIARMIGGIPVEQERRHHGEIINQVKDRVAAAIAARKNELKEKRIAEETGSAPATTTLGTQSSVSTSVGKAVGTSIVQAVSVTHRVIRASADVDVTLPVREAPAEIGRVHPITQVTDELTAIFADMGFAVAEGPDIETNDYNFTKLNFPEDHPARDMHDTFFFNPKPDGTRLLLRTHTSPVQVRTMLSQKPPIRVIIPGRTYRRDSDQTHTPMFHQVEGLVIDKGSHLGHLKWILEEFFKAFFEVDRVGMRFRPGFFPFTEPSLEVDLQYRRDKGEVRFGEGDQWMEILGCGMVHPNVLKNCSLDPDEYQGFAWGMGIDRLAMLKYGMPDLRTFFEADVRWLSHYGFRPLDVPTLAGGLSS
jgi:phenylalanyl-tRNA synthetase alpha chain